MRNNANSVRGFKIVWAVVQLLGQDQPDVFFA
jgi:hypothetical protein